MVGILESVKNDDLEKVVTSLILYINLASLPLKGTCKLFAALGKKVGFIKLSNREDCQALLNVKSDLNNVTMKDFGFEENNQIYVNEGLCPYYRVPWAKSKSLHHLQKIFSFYVSNGSIKIKTKENDKGVTITHAMDFRKNFPGIDLRPPSQS